MVWYNPFSWKKQLQIRELYCQNPDCKSPLIRLGSQVALFKEGDNLSITHANKFCYMAYGDTRTLKQGGIFSAIRTFIEYDEAIRLAEQGRLKFSCLELTAQRK